MQIRHAISVAMLAGAFASTAVQPGFSRGDWPDSPLSRWFKALKRPDGWKNPDWDEKSKYCCDVADAVKTRFKLEKADGARYPEDAWYAWINDTWVEIPSEKIVDGFAPNGEGYVFFMAGTIQCFVRPRGGI
jgi:hypothetical protein